MCLIAMAWRHSARYPLVIAANRDEAHARASERATWWKDTPGVYGGRDLVAGGSWLAITREGRLAAVTNLHEPPRREFPHSRGALVSAYLAGRETAAEFSARIEPEASSYGPFNLLLYDGTLHYASNRAPGAALAPGIHVFGNAIRGTRWPKLTRAEAGIRAALEHADPVPALLALLAERRDPAAARTPREYLESTLFVANGAYGTRCSTVVLLDAQGEVRFVERSFGPDGALLGDTTEVFSVPPGERT